MTWISLKINTAIGMQAIKFVFGKSLCHTKTAAVVGGALLTVAIDCVSKCVKFELHPCVRNSRFCDAKPRLLGPRSAILGGFRGAESPRPIDCPVQKLANQFDRLARDIFIIAKS